MEKLQISHEGQGAIMWALSSIAAAMLAGTIYIFVC